MGKEEIVLIVLAVCALVFCLGFAKNKAVYLGKFLLRTGLGFVAVYIINALFAAINIPLLLGVNFCSICTIGFLGAPGLLLLYGIIGSRFL